MVDSLTNEIILGIAAKIKEIYKGKANYPIYTDSEEQGIEKPCFFIKSLNGEETREIGIQNQYYKDLRNIVIIGHTINGNTEILNNMADNLCNLEYIELSDKTLIRAEKLHYKIEDDILHFFVDYKLFIEKNKNKEQSMDGFTLNGEVKNESN